MSSDPENKTEAAAPQSEAKTGMHAGAETERLQMLERENADLKDRLLRALAEMENLRRRTERELHDQRAYSITKFATDIVGTSDNLRRALDAVPQPEGDDGAEFDGPIKALIDGVELTERELLKALERHGVKKRVPVGEKFDPHRDQAMFEVPDEAQFSGTVVQVVQPGYMIGERVLRPAMVGVSRGGPTRPVGEPDTHAPDAQGAAAQAGMEPPPKPRFDKRA
jgi:molecular chaperone GrpE